MAKVIVQGINLEVTDALKTQCQDHFGKVIDSFENFVVEDVVVRLEVEKEEQKASVTIPVKGNDIVITTSSSDMYATISELASKASRQLRKHKEKAQARGTKDKYFTE